VGTLARCFREAVGGVLEGICDRIETDIKQRHHVETASVLTLEQVFTALEVFEMLRRETEHFTTLLRPVEELDGEEGEVEEKVGVAWSLVRRVETFTSLVASLTTQTLQRFREDIDAVAVRHLPLDGNVHRVSSNCLHFVRRVAQGEARISCLLALTMPPEGEGKERSNVKYLMSSTLKKLLVFVEIKARQYKNSRVGLVFLLNNYEYMREALEEMPALEWSKEVVGEILARVEECIRRTLERAGDEMTVKCEGSLIDPVKELVYVKGSVLLTLESGRVLKDKFQRFNGDFKALDAQMVPLSVYSETLRRRLVECCLRGLADKYLRFFDKYSNVQFSKKHADKYVVYTPDALHACITQWFGNAHIEEG
jgi:exocyst complex protein 7